MKEAEQIKKGIESNRLVRYLQEDDYEPLKLKVYAQRKKRLDYWLHYVALALIAEMIGVFLDIFARTQFNDTSKVHQTLEIIATISSSVALILVLVAFVYLLSARRSKIMKDIRTHELL